MKPEPLFNEAAELALLGVVMVRQEVLDDVIDLLEPEHFGRHHHRLVFAAMRHLHKVGCAIDPVTVCERLAQTRDLDEVTKPFIYSLGDGVPRSSNVSAYAGVIRDKALLRRLREIGDALQRRAQVADASGTALLEEAEELVYGLSASAIRSNWVSGEELAAELRPVVKTLCNERGRLNGIPSGVRDLDRITRGFQAGELVLLGARPSAGKTALAIQIAMHVATASPVAFFSLEMARQPIGLRAVAAAGQIDSWRLLSGRLPEADLRRAGHGLAVLGSASLHLDESGTLSPVHVRSKLRRLQARVGPVGLVVIDYLQLLAPLDEHRHENQTNRVGGISRALKVLAREFGVPFLVLSQLSRAVEKRETRRPTMADLRDSGALEQDADVVLLLHHPESDDEEVAELIIAKHRNGPTGTIALTWHETQMRFEDRPPTVPKASVGNPSTTPVEAIRE